MVFSNQQQQCHITIMSSTQQLLLGAKLSSGELRAKWLKLNHDSGHCVKIVQSIEKPKARYFSVCYSAPKTGWKAALDTCRCHVKAIGCSSDEMEIVSIDTTHSCSKTDSSNKRKRNYRTTEICRVSDILSVYEPAKSGNTKQFAAMTKAATGVTIKNGQANLAVKSKSDDTVEAQMGQYFWLRSLFRIYQESDPDGRYLLEECSCLWAQQLKQFKRCYVTLSIAKHFWSCAGIGLICCDGTFTKNNCFKQIVLLATTFDANNQIVVLAMGIVDVENGDNWAWFKECLESDFPGIEVWMSDADKGIYSNTFSLSLSQSVTAFALSRCARHLAENCRENCAGTMNEEQKKLITELAKSRTEDVYQKRLENIRKLNRQWAEWLDPRKEEFAAVSFLERGYRRWGKVTSNGVETINGVFGEARSYPIVYLIEHVLQYQREKYHERCLQACKWSDEGKRMTKYARDIQIELADKASRKTVQFLEQNHPIYRARVQAAQIAPLVGYVEVLVNLDAHYGECPCQYYDELGISCAHIKAVLLALNKTTTWCSRRYHIDSYKAAYSATIPSMVVGDKLSIDDTFAPPNFKKPAGRPAKKRKERRHFRTDKQRECQACGGFGHYALTCTAPSTEYRYYKHKDKAIRYCQSVQDKIQPEN
jgi:MULE transposase domain